MYIAIMLEKIHNCYDSHTHFWATGQVAEGLKLQDLKSEHDMGQLTINPQHYRAKWLTGFGWNQNDWPQSKLPSRQSLDQVFPNTPVFLSRVDGHASWINSLGIQELKKMGFDLSKDISGGIIERDSSGEPTGLLFDQAHIQALIKLPDFSESQHIDFFKSSQNIFNKAGFTHVRDMSMNFGAWNTLRKLEEQNDLTVCIDSFITVENLSNLDATLIEVEQIKKDNSRQLRLNGLKIFIDGSLGSKTAFLSENYKNTDSNGLLIWSEEEIEQLLRLAWPKNLQVAIHCIGDAAVNVAVRAARNVSAKGILGRLHLEHVQLLSPETVQLMKPLHVTCHLQPCHWLSDYKWLPDVLSKNLINFLFQWELLRKNKIPFHFGSDSPIERPSLFDNKRALIKSAEAGIPKLNADWKLYHQHPDKNWCPSFTEIDEESVKQVYFNGEPLL